MWLFGTNGFLVFHALLMTLCFACAYAFLVARSEPIPCAALCAGVSVRVGRAGLHGVADAGLLQSGVGAHRVFFLVPTRRSRQSRRRSASGAGADVADGAALRSRGRGAAGHRDVLEADACLLDCAACSCCSPVRRQWMRGRRWSVCFAAVVGGLFAWNVAITGEWNYQGGDRKTFYSI